MPCSQQDRFSASADKLQGELESLDNRLQQLQNMEEILEKVEGSPILTRTERRMEFNRAA